jgi:hypothetical protein
LRGAPSEIGAAFCGTVEGLAWIGQRKGGKASVWARPWVDPDAREILTLPADRDPSLVCGDHEVIVLGDGDDDLTAARFVPGGGPVRERSTVVARSADFADEEREHEAFAVGDELGLVRVGASGSVSERTIPPRGEPGPWRTLHHALSDDDELVAVDGDEAATLIVTTREGRNSCAGIGSTAESVRVIRFDRRSGEESALDLAPADCNRARGPFWVAAAPGGQVVAWVDRQTTVPPKAAAIAGLSFRVVRGDGLRPGQIDQPADGLVDGGCDRGGCLAAALVRRPGSDGMRPAAIHALAYP